MNLLQIVEIDEEAILPVDSTKDKRIDIDEVKAVVDAKILKT